MSVTTPTVHVPDTRLPVASWMRRNLMWLLIALAVVATAVLVTLTVVDSDSVPETVPATQSDASTTDAGTAGKPTSIADASIRAIEHRAEATSGIRYESITATEHRTANGGR